MPDRSRSFSVLVIDPDYAFTKAYGLRWDAPSETAYPSTFVIAKGGKITFSHISHQHGDRVKAEAVLKMLPAEMTNPQAK
ncbi:MAG TPA: redoxin family protein [Candidatus Angelobacter sp.]|nr:redoxin family protein [Candidatus Angelobacter sp.]